MPDRKRQRDGSVIVRARPYDRRPEAKPKRPVIGSYPDTEKGWRDAVRAEEAWYSVNRPDAQVTVGKLREDYLADHATRWDVLSTRAARDRLRGFCDRYATEPAEAITSTLARTWAASHPDARQALTALWNWGRRADMVQENPWEKIGAEGTARSRRAEVIKPGRGALTEPELASFAAFCGGLVGEWLERMVTFTGYSGLRQGEVFASRPDWISGELLEVEEQYRTRAPEGERWTLPKMGKTRTLALLPEAAAALGPIDPGTLFLFTSPRDGTHWTASGFAYYWTRTAEAWSMSADAPAWLRKRHRMVKANRTNRRSATGALTVHELRHTFATLLLESGVPHGQVALQLGDTVQQVYKTYGHPRSLAAAQDVLEIRAATKARRAATVTDLAAERARRAG
jgi:integrase